MSTRHENSPAPTRGTTVRSVIAWCLDNRLVVFLVTLLTVAWGWSVMPFNLPRGPIPANPTPVDAIPDIGENQQIVFTAWPGRSPQDIEDQVTYPLTAALLGIPDVRSVRSYSFFGFSSIYVIFNEDAEWDWSRAKILEKLASLAPDTLPVGASPSLGPDATALGQVFWYTLEGLDPVGTPTGGWASHELRSIQDYHVRYALQAVDGVAEVASVGGFQKEYQIDIDPDALRAFGISLPQVAKAVQESNLDVGARSMEINRVEYLIRGLGFLQGVEDLRETVVASRDGLPITLDQIAEVGLGPAMRRGALDKGGAEAVGGVVVTRYGANPLTTIERVKAKIQEIAPSLPRRILDDGTVSQVTLVPFYDRSDLIHETITTLGTALLDEALITVLVILLLVWHLRSSLLISLMLPLAVLVAFIAMKLFHVDANIVALSGIAIAIGTIVDLGIVLCENCLRRLREAAHDDSSPPPAQIILNACSEVGGAILTAVMTTVISFLPVFAMEGAEGKLFKPLAFTKTFALIGAILVSLLLLPPLIRLLFRPSLDRFSGDSPRLHRIAVIVLATLAWLVLATHWAPLGPDRHFANPLLVGLAIGLLLLGTLAVMRYYVSVLRFFLGHKAVLLGIVSLVLAGGVFSWSSLGKEFVPALDEGSFLLMPTTMPHASIGEALEVIQMQDRAIAAIPEVISAVGKIGRADSPLDPAPVSMVETIINYHPEWGKDAEGNRVRLWRDHIRAPEDIWKEITFAAALPGVTSAPKLQPIETRLIMLQTGMRAPMGIKLFGPDLATLAHAGSRLESLLKEVPEIDPATVFADRVVGKPYLEITPDRSALARYGISVQRFQSVLQTAVGGRIVTTTVEGRERYPVRVRYLRERRDSIEELGEILMPAPDGKSVPLGQLAGIEFVRGPMVIKSEDTFLVSYVIFDRHPGQTEVEVVESAAAHLAQRLEEPDQHLPDGVSYRFTGSYENQVRAEKKLALVVPLALVLIFLVLYLQFRRVTTSLLVFSGIFVAWSGGFLLLWLYGQPWFLDTAGLGLPIDLRDLFQIHTINLSVAVWVGFLALFGIATDDGVLMATILEQRFREDRPADVAAVHAATLEAAAQRNRPAMLTTATTLLALMPVLSSTGRGSDIMVPMAIPTFGGMLVAVLTIFVVPTLYCWMEERRLGLPHDDDG